MAGVERLKGARQGPEGVSGRETVTQIVGVRRHGAGVLVDRCVRRQEDRLHRFATGVDVSEAPEAVEPAIGGTVPDSLASAQEFATAAACVAADRDELREQGRVRGVHRNDAIQAVQSGCAQLRAGGLFDRGRFGRED